MADTHRSAGAVTVRQLARDTSAIIDRVRERNRPMLITRYGIPVASIQPLDIEAWTPSTSATSIGELEEPEIEWDTLDLDDGQRQVLRKVGDRFLMQDVADAADATPGQVALICAHLEIKRLATKTMMGYHLTQLGRRVAEQLRNP